MVWLLWLKSYLQAYSRIIETFVCGSLVGIKSIRAFKIVTKGQLISEQIYAVLNFPKMQRNIARISALATKMVQIRKIKAHNYAN